MKELVIVLLILTSAYGCYELLEIATSLDKNGKPFSEFKVIEPTSFHVDYKLRHKGDR